MNLEKRFDTILKEYSTLRIGVEASDWQDVIRKAVGLLVDAKIATSDYSEAIINATDKFGPYYVIADHVIMPHAQTGPYNLQNGFSMMTLKKPVMFGDNPVNVVICLSSTTPDFHVATALPQIAALFEDPEMGQKLAKAQTEDEIFKLISSVDYRKYLNS